MSTAVQHNMCRAPPVRSSLHTVMASARVIRHSTRRYGVFVWRLTMNTTTSSVSVVIPADSFLAQEQARRGRLPRRGLVGGTAGATGRKKGRARWSGRPVESTVHSEFMVTARDEVAGVFGAVPVLQLGAPSPPRGVQGIGDRVAHRADVLVG